MKNSMMMIAVISALGMTAAAHAQMEQKPAQDRARSEYADPAKKCDGLKGDARTACLNDAQKTGKDDMKSAPKAPETKK
jgi:hypothetical protein